MAAAAAVGLDADMPERKEGEDAEAAAAADPVGSLTVTLKDATGQVVVLLQAHCQLSQLLHTVLDQDPGATEIPLPSLTDPAVLPKIAEYLQHHKGTAGTRPDKPLRSKKMSEVLTDPWDVTFLESLDVPRRKTLIDVYTVRRDES